MTSEPGSLRAFILAQALEPAGAAVVLFTDATLAGVDPGLDDDRAAAGVRARRDGTGVPGEGAAAGPVEQAAGALGLDTRRLELFGADAYVLQTALGTWLVGR